MKVCERPFRIRVILGEESSQMMEFNPDCKISDVFKRIEDHMGRQFSPDNFQLVMESPDFKEPIPLEENKVMRDYISSDNVSDRAFPRPAPYRLSFLF